MESAQSPQPKTSAVHAAPTPRHPLPSSRPQMKTEPSDTIPNPAAAPMKKRKRASKPDGPVTLKAPKMEPADSPHAEEQALLAIAQTCPKLPSTPADVKEPAVRKSPAVVNDPAAVKDCPADNELTPVKIEHPDASDAEPPSAERQRGAERVRKPKPTTKAQIADLLKTVAAKFTEFEETMSRQEQTLAEHADKIRKLGKEVRHMNTSLHRLRRWVTVAQKQGVPIPAQDWRDLRNSYSAKEAKKSNGASQTGVAPETGQQGLNGASCAGVSEK